MKHVDARALLRRASVLARAVVAAQFAAVLALVVYLAVHLSGVVFNPPPRALNVQVVAACYSVDPSAACYASVTRLASGRFRVATDGPASSLMLSVAPASEMQRARFALVRARTPVAAVDATPVLDDGAAIAPLTFVAPGARAVAPVPAVARPIDRLIFTTKAPAERWAIDEIAFYESDRGLLNDVRRLFPGIPAEIFYGILVPRTLLPFCILAAAAAFVIPRPLLRRINPVAIGTMCFAFSLLDLAILYSPYGSGDLRVFYASGPLQQPAGNNLNGALWQAWRVLQGNGLTIVPRVVPWERMPGYGLFCTAAALMFGHARLLDVPIATVLLQVLFYSSAAAVFAWAAGKLWPPAVVWIVGLLIALLPKQLGYTQVDSIIAPVALLVAASLCVWLRTSIERGSTAVRSEAAVHAAFALWFLMRPDVLPGWLVVSAIMHWRHWRRLLIPVALSAAIGITWGLYKQRYTGEFVPTTSSLGATLLCGLWEVPSRFTQTCADDQYFEWIAARTGLQPKTQAASNFTLKEVVRFWITYPGHFIIMVNHKMMEFLDRGAWPGFRTDLQRGTDAQRVVARVLGRPVITLALLAVIGLSLACGHQRLRTVLLGWPIFFNAPLFWVMQASAGRFYSAVPIGLLAAAVPPLFEGQFYRALAARPIRAAAVVAGVVVFGFAAWPLHDWLLRNDTLHYWTPLLDPSRSMLVSRE